MYQFKGQTLARANTEWRTSDERTSGSRLTDPRRFFKNAAKNLLNRPAFNCLLTALSGKANNSGMQ
ncbi:hypothetical protein L914_19233, partial [Phytophthora nicotianae]